jgi:transposase
LLGDVVSEFCDTDKSALSHRRFSSAGVIPHRHPSLQQSNNASFHRSQDFRRCWERWLACGLRVRYLPCYSPHLNLMETVWRRVKGGLMPRRYYEDVASLRAAVVAGLKQLGGEELKI